MKLYHGTSVAAAKRAIKMGLLPRSNHSGKTNWLENPSHPDCVYLTNTYAAYFAINSVPEKVNTKAKGPQCAIIEIDTDKLDTFYMVPDEDALEQAQRGQDNIQGDMFQRTEIYRNNMDQYVGTDAWETSLAVLGNCAYMGDIPPEAISKVIWLRCTDMPNVTLAAMDAAITLQNFMFAGNQHRAIIGAIMDDPDYSKFSGIIPVEYHTYTHYREQARKAVTIEEYCA